MQKPLLSDLPKYCLQIWELLLSLWFGDVHLREERRVKHTTITMETNAVSELTMFIKTFNL